MAITLTKTNLITIHIAGDCLYRTHWPHTIHEMIHEDSTNSHLIYYFRFYCVSSANKNDVHVIFYSLNAKKNRVCSLFESVNF